MFLTGRGMNGESNGCEGNRVLRVKYRGVELGFDREISE